MFPDNKIFNKQIPTSLIMPAIVDNSEIFELSGYLNKMSFRLESLQNTASQLSVQIDHSISGSQNQKKEFVSALGVIKKEVDGIKEEVRSVQKTILEIIEQLKSSVKTEELARFKKRIDLWNPEGLVTRREVERVLREL
ncbi:hypothetical protein KY348_06915 [Candidatus Woesearchaeota archaeon]|nr:hypothetical protein [Candidatus Woesearchaeota archaeon]